jgi:polynucleotide 5'-kinase involved in rRNA processing
MTIVASEVAGRTVMVVGGPGTGKTAWVREAARQLAEGPGRVAVVSADMGQQSVGVPTCLGLSLNAPFDRASAMWFIGDTSPAGNLLPAVVGTARLVSRARAEGAQTVLIDTTGVADSGAGYVLKYHKVLAAGVDCLVALQKNGKPETVLGLLGSVCPMIHRTAALAEAKDRSAAERKAYRQACYRSYFQEAGELQLEPGRLVGANWMPNAMRHHEFPLPGAVLGLLDGQGFCLGIGLVEKLLPNRLVVHTPWPDAAAVVSVKLGKLRLDRQAEFAEVREPAPPSPPPPCT